MEDLREAALLYASMGYRVLPVVPGGKEPLYDPSLGLRRGKDDALDDPDKVREVWRKHPQANVALVPPEDVVVLDLDSPLALPVLLLLSEVFLRAPHASTGSGGAHVWVRWPQGLPTPPARARALPSLALDLRGLGKSYVVVPPSLHPSGRRYAWVHPLLPPEELPVLPLSIAKALLPPKPKRGGEGAPPPLRELPSNRERAYALAELQGRCQEMASTPEGRRHTELVRHAVALWGWVRRGVLDEEEVWHHLGLAALRSGLEAKEVEGVFRWVRTTTPERALRR